MFLLIKALVYLHFGSKQEGVTMKDFKILLNMDVKALDQVHCRQLANGCNEIGYIC